MAKRLARRQDPDEVLILAVDLLAGEVKRLEQRHRADSPACDACGQGGTLTDEERRFLIQATGKLADIAFKSRELLTDRMLRQLSQGQLEQLAGAVGGAEWLPR